MSLRPASGRWEALPRGLAAVLVLLIHLSGMLRAATPEDSWSYDSYGKVLASFVDDRGLVDYAALKADSAELRAFLDQLAQLPAETYQSWSRNDQIAFWINAYNALTLKAILDHYPIQPGFLTSLVYPKNSIRQISGVWDELKFLVKGEPLTLDQIEHQVLRQRFGDPRIHVALVCAALSCPALRREPYLGSRLREQLADQARRFTQRPDSFRLEEGNLYLSKIFDWFGDDFVARYGRLGEIPGHGPTQSAVLQFLLPHLAPAQQQMIRSGAFKIRYTDYDWTLNEQPR